MLHCSKVSQGSAAFLKQQGHADANLRVGEDVGRIDMIACATPHLGAPWLGGSSQCVNDDMSNCVRKNACALKQLEQAACHSLLGRPVPLPEIPEDGPYTLLRITTEEECRCSFR